MPTNNNGSIQLPNTEQYRRYKLVLQHLEQVPEKDLPRILEAYLEYWPRTNLYKSLPAIQQMVNFVKSIYDLVVNQSTQTMALHNVTFDELNIKNYSNVAA